MPVYKNGYTISEDLQIIPEVRCYVSTDDLAELAEEPLRNVIQRHHDKWFQQGNGYVLNRDYLIQSTSTQYEK